VFGDELSKLRAKAGLTQEEVGAAAGISREYVSMLESGKNTPTIDVFVRLCRAVGSPPAEVLARIERHYRRIPSGR
jgi:transcriptional regulator with XRE-family HTH domain